MHGEENYNVIMKAHNSPEPITIAIPTTEEHAAKPDPSGVSDRYGRPTTAVPPLKNPPKYKKSISTAARMPSNGEFINRKHDIVWLTARKGLCAKATRLACD